MKTKFSKVLYTTVIIIVIAILIMILTNPSYKDFTEYTPDQKTKNHYSLRKRVKNYLVFSVYEITTFDREYDDDDFREQKTMRYTGFIKNFYPE